MRVALATCALVLCAVAATPVKSPAPAAKKPTTRASSSSASVGIGEKVVAFCKAHMGETVANGECAGLASKALHDSGAKRRGGKDNPDKGDYVWGEQVYLIEAGGKTEGKAGEIRPGDVVQYRDVKFAGRRREGRGKYTASAHHHTAIVSSVEDGGTTVHIYQQNFAGKRFVTTATLYLGDLKEGWLRFYHPVPLPAGTVDKSPDPADER